MPDVTLPAAVDGGGRRRRRRRRTTGCRRFSDDQLTSRSPKPSRTTPTCASAASRVEQALLYAKLAGAKLYPSVDLLARGGGKMSGDSSGLQGAVLTVTWELDLWGRVRYGRAAATADAAVGARPTTSTRGSRSPRWSPRTGFWPPRPACRPSWRAETVGGGEELVGWPTRASRVGVGNEQDVYVARANGRAPIATRCGSSSSRASRRSERSKC